ncbi:MAG: glycosyl transferase family 1 [Rhodospirillales bacterium]|jgi:glycogen(starch) synthase|nr:glycosyl transferase family 1 [Rhodospirillales bacterium]
MRGDADGRVIPLRVMMTADAVGGVWRYALTLACELSCAVPSGRAEIFLAVMGPPPSAAQRVEAAAIPDLRLFVGNFPLEWMKRAENSFESSCTWLRELAASCRPDIIHFNGYAHAAGDWPAPSVVVGHSCVLSWWRAVHGVAAPPEWRGYARRVGQGLMQADRIVAPTAAMLRALTEHYGAPRGRVIANGCELNRFRPRAKEDFVLSAGRLWDEGKNLATLDAAAERIGCPVYVAGDFDHPNGRRSQPSASRMLGVLAPEVLGEWMSRAAIYALPARYEPFGLSILEAAASGCALVLGDIPALRELWDKAALFVPPNDSLALAQAIEALRGDGAALRRLSAAAHRRSRAFAAARMARSYAALYGEVAPPRGIGVPASVAVPADI